MTIQSAGSSDAVTVTPPTEAEVIAFAEAHAAAVVDRLWERYANDPRFVFDKAAAEKACDFFPTFLRHSKGRLAGKPFHLKYWQRRVVSIIFGFKWASTGRRVVRRAYLFIARKNGKSTFAAGLALLLLLAGERSAEIYSAAADREQASIVFREAASMVLASPPLSRVCEVFKRSVICARLMSSYGVLSSDAETKHGLNPSGIIFDELHTQPNRDLLDVLHTAVGAREEPLEALMTTAGSRRQGICWEVHEQAVRVRDGVDDDPSLLPILFMADEADDWTDPRTWAKANPSVGDAVSLEYLAQECAHAKRVPGYENTFRRLHLNMWTQQDTRWLPMADWQQCAGPVGWKELARFLFGRPCFGALDLSSTTDITAWVKLFPPQGDDDPWFIVPRFFVPERNIDLRSRRDRVPYDLWARDGAMTATPGNVVDYGAVEMAIREDAGAYGLIEAPYDRWNATQLVTNLTADGLPMVPFGQGFASMSAPAKRFEAMVVGHELAHGGHPVLHWMAENVAIDRDAADNIKPNKATSGERIDGIVAAVMALGRAIVFDGGGQGVEIPADYEVPLA
ncbi:terminase TerL endonuclease subunit (plasmid) [Azospirillum sp. HJ39]|uniref:terminase large subunit n=1 Tax=Azospirillum sp. HJ39 TaxID=3159496 RepID=UPI003557A148